MSEEIECPCEEQSRENCAACQELPDWYFDTQADAEPFDEDEMPDEEYFRKWAKYMPLRYET